MKRINLLAGVLFVLVGFCAGVGFSLFSAKIEAQGRPEPPPMALKTVEHDATLTGDGTTVAPLGLANGAVTAPKLSAAAVPSVGQVLGFNGANLAWQDTSVGGVQVVDSLGQEVGPLARSLGPLALRQIGPIVFQLGVDSNGFNLNSISFYYTSQNCSGLRYLQQDQTTTLWRTTYIRGTRAFYPSDPLEQINVMSREDIPPNADPNLPGQCKSDVRIISGGSVAIFDLSTLGLVPPFRLEY